MPRAPASVSSALFGLARAFERLRLPWYVFGAQALALRGMPRATADLDVTVLVGDASATALVATLEREGFELKFGDADFIERTQVLALVHTKGGLPVDVVLGKPGLEDVFLAGATSVRVGRRDIPVASATHLLVMKVLAARPKDLEDAANLLRVLPHDTDAGAAEALLQEIASAIGEDDPVTTFAKVRARAARR